VTGAAACNQLLADGWVLLGVYRLTTVGEMGAGQPGDGEQEFYASKSYTNEPRRCPQCRSARKSQQRGSRDSYDQPEKCLQRFVPSNPVPSVGLAPHRLGPRLWPPPLPGITGWGFQ
jgi:hypothetical protein